MKRVILALAVAVVFLGGGLAGSAQAHGPHGQHHGHGHGHHGHHGHHHQGHHHHNHGGYRYPVYVPYRAYQPRVVPYGAAYGPSNGLYIQQPRFGLYLGF